LPVVKPFVELRIKRKNNLAGNHTDEQLVEMFHDAQQKHYAYNLLVQRHQEKAYFFVRKLVIDHEDTNDVVQEVFIKVWNNLSKFRAESKFSTWLYRICHHESIDHLRKKRKNVFQSIDDVQHQLASRIDEDPLYDGDELRKRLDKAVLGLPHKQRIIFVLKYFEEKKFSEIAEITGTSEGALKASYHHAVKKIEQFFKED
jgi:RNA polymerase sigma factor (sigma-70 family)